MEMKIREMFTITLMAMYMYSLTVLSNDSVYILFNFGPFHSVRIWLILQIEMFPVQDICYILRKHLECPYYGRRKVDRTLHYAGPQINMLSFKSCRCFLITYLN